MKKIIISLIALNTITLLALPAQAIIPTEKIQIENSEDTTYIANSNSLGIKQSMPYGQARQILIDQGWQAQIPVSLGAYPNIENSTIKYLFTDRGYQEVEDCSGTGLGLCRFKFRNAQGQSLIVVTANNQPGQEVSVFSWFFE